MALHNHLRCGHTCNCAQPGNNGCVACIVLWKSANGPTATSADLQSMIDAKYGLIDPVGPLGSLDIP